MVQLIDLDVKLYEFYFLDYEFLVLESVLASEVIRSLMTWGSTDVICK